MSVIVKNMDLPEACYLDVPPWRCPFNDGLVCTRLNIQLPSKLHWKHPKCPVEAYREPTVCINEETIFVEQEA